MSTAFSIVPRSHFAPPLSAEELDRTLDQWSPEPEPVDMNRLRSMAGDDPTEIRELAQLYMAEMEEVMSGLRIAIRDGAVDKAEGLAHKLGGASATCGMIGIVAPLRELEITGKAGEWPVNEILLHEAVRQQDRIGAYLAAHVLAA